MHGGAQRVIVAAVVISPGSGTVGTATTVDHDRLSRRRAVIDERRRQPDRGRAAARLRHLA